MAEASSDALLSAMTVSAAVPAAADTGLALNVPGCEIFSRPVRSATCEVQQVQDVLASRDAGARQAARDNLREGRQIGPHAERHLRAAPCRAKPGDNLVEHEQRAMLPCRAAQFLRERGVSGTWPNDDPVGS